MRILHLSDLHFGCDKDNTDLEKRINCFQKLIPLIEQIAQEKSINYLVITGDVAWRASETDYELASKYIKEICEKINLKIDNLIICAGNHDIDRSMSKHDSVPVSFEEANQLYRAEELPAISRSFANYEKFCTNIGLKKAELRTELRTEVRSYLVGVKTFENVNFVILNSSWASISDKLDNKMWIGNNFIQTIVASKLIDPTKVTITLMHHPEAALDSLERSYYEGTKNTYSEIQKFSDLILCGHSHETKVEPKPSISGGYTISGGATYINNSYRNGVVCYDIPDRKSLGITPYVYEHDEWKKTTSESYELRKEHIIAKPHITTDGVSIYRELLKFGFKIENCQECDFNTSGTIIWPIVPRKNVTHIHQAQIELMSIMSNLFKWKVKVLISDCGSKSNRLNAFQLKNFREKITDLLHKRNVDVDSISNLRKFFVPSYENADKVFEHFINISSSIEKKQLTALKNKEYNTDIQEANEKLPVLDYILPLLQMSVVCQLGEEINKNSESKKTLILAGNDETDQWRHVCREYANDYLGALLIPVLRDNEKTDSWQQGIRQYLSAAELREDIKKGNFGFWCYCMFIKLQSYNKKVKINDFSLQNEDVEYWRNNNFNFPEKFDYQQFVEEIWKTIGLAV